ncbi:MAG: Curved DNA-binding protein [Verrucomicrobiota bacterium]
MQRTEPIHYAALGLDREASAAQIRDAYRLLAKKFHPDVNPRSREAVARTQQLNAAYSILGDPARRRAYDTELAVAEKAPTAKHVGKIKKNVVQDVLLPLENFLRGTTREIRINDPANPDGVEIYQLVVPAGTAPGAKFELARLGTFAGGTVELRLKALPHFRFKVRGADLHFEYKIKAERAAEGGEEQVPGASGSPVRLKIPRGTGRGAVLRVKGEGLPKLQGGRGDLVVKISYRVEVRVGREGKV